MALDKIPNHNHNVLPKTVFLKYNGLFVKVNTFGLDPNTPLARIAANNFEGRSFPDDIHFILDGSQAQVIQLHELQDGAVVSIEPHRPETKAQAFFVAYVTNFSESMSISNLKDLLGLDESISDDMFHHSDVFRGDHVEKGVFIELLDELQLSSVLKMNGFKCVDSDKVVKVVEAKDSEKKRYNKLMKKYDVVKVKRVPKGSVPADLRIFFDQIPIYSANIIADGIAFVEVETNDTLKALKYNGHQLFNTPLSVKRSSEQVMNTAILDYRRRCFNGEFEPENPRRDEIFESPAAAPISQPRFEDRDFKCVLLSGLPSGSSELDVARFFADLRIQPVQTKIDSSGTKAFCEFAAIEEADKAISLNNKNLVHRKITVKRVKYSTSAEFGSQDASRNGHHKNKKQNKRPKAEQPSPYQRQAENFYIQTTGNAPATVSTAEAGGYSSEIQPAVLGNSSNVYSGYPQSAQNSYTGQEKYYQPNPSQVTQPAQPSTYYNQSSGAYGQLETQSQEASNVYGAQMAQGYQVQGYGGFGQSTGSQHDYNAPSDMQKM